MSLRRLSHLKTQFRYATNQIKPIVDFSDSKVSFKTKSLTELVRSKVVFMSCQIPPLIKNAEVLMRTSYKLLGMSITNFFLRKSFFGHFCAGEDEDSIRPTIEMLEKNGIGSILDYAAESDVEEAKEIEEDISANSQEVIPSATAYAEATKVKCRTYDYKNEEICDIHMRTFEKAIRSVRNVSPTGFAAIKLTALGNPELLKHASNTLMELHKLFYKLDPDNTGFVKREDFLATFNKKIEGKDVLAYFDIFDADHDGKIDYIEWSNGIKLEELHLLTEHCTIEGPLFNSVLDENEIQLFKRMRERIENLCTLAESLGVRLMIDAEHTYFQPAIDNMTLGLMKRFNTPGKIPVIFSTYQMYLKDSWDRYYTDLERARKGDYTFAAKLVRGAYMILERNFAKENGFPDPIMENIQKTHENYNKAIREAVRRISEGEHVEIMIATHNQESVEIALESMSKYGISPNSGVYFGQLLGMMDHITFSLGNKGYKAYKYVPYGKVNEVMPYLMRRAQENADALSGSKIELQMINKEIRRRIKTLF